MADDARILELVEEALCSDRTPEEVCANDAELLADVRACLNECRRVDLMVESIFPSPAPEPVPWALGAQSQPGAPLPEIPDYQVLAVLGRGGHGIVYRVRHLKLKRVAALKMLLTGEYASPAELARFMREAESIAALQHPNIVQVFDVGEADGRPYFTMEFVGGGSLAQKQGGVPQPTQYTASVAESLARAVHAAHLAGIVHRDVKPGNVLLTPDGRPKITDFGLARHFEGPSDVTLGPARVGTPSYMAPEQVVAAPDTIGPPADIYGLGATLYELLTGRPPFRAESAAETERQVLTQEPVAPSKLNSKVPHDLETICLKCLHKEPGRRYETAAALADDLRRFQRGEPIAARRTGSLERSGKWMRRHPGPTVAAASVVMLLVLAATAVARLLWSRAELLRGVNDDLAAVARFEHAGEWNYAREALERAKGRLGERDVSDSRARLSQSERDLKLVTDLAAIRLGRAELVGERPKYAEAAARYEAAFAAAGLNVNSLSPAAAAERIKASPIRNELIAALDDWAVCAQSREQLERIYDVARHADPDRRWRDKVRNAGIVPNPRALSDLAAAAPIAGQSVSVLVALGQRIDRAKGDPVPFCRLVQLQYPGDFWANFLLANVLQERRNPESITYYLAARAIRPDALIVYINLSAELGFEGRSAEAREYAERAVVIDPRSAPAQCGLGVCLLQLGRYEEAIASCGNALAIDKGYYFAVGVMCQALIDDGRLAEANSVLQHCVGAMPQNDPEYGRLQRLASHCKELVEWDGHLTDVLSGKEQVTPLRRRQVATVCLLKRRYGDAVRLFDAAFAADPALANDVASGARFEAACAASRAAEQSNEMPERARLLNQAITWLRGDLAAWSTVLDRGRESDRLQLLRAVYPWRSEPRLASIRDPKALRVWPPEQQAQCRALWRDVGALLVRAEAAAEWADEAAPVAVDQAAATRVAADQVAEARTCVARRDWAGAANCYARALAGRQTDDGHFWFEYAAVLVLSSDRQGYASACARLIDRCGKQGGPRPYHVARSCTLAPDAVPDASVPGRLADDELRRSATQFWSLTERGALAYRSGQLEQSVSLFEQSLKADPRPGCAVVNWLWLSMAEQRLGHTDEARRWLERARKWLGQYPDGMPADAEEKLGLHLHNWLEAHVLLREAEALLASK